MTTLEDWISQACDMLGLHVDFAFVVDIDGGHRVRTVARIRNLGARNGMLVIRNYDDVRPYAERLVQDGYGYSVLEEPRVDETFDLNSFKEMFRDWGWSGPDGQCPLGLL